MKTFKEWIESLSDDEIHPKNIPLTARKGLEYIAKLAWDASRKQALAECRAKISKLKEDYEVNNTGKLS